MSGDIAFDAHLMVALFAALRGVVHLLRKNFPLTLLVAVLLLYDIIRTLHNACTSTPRFLAFCVESPLCERSSPWVYVEDDEGQRVSWT